MLRSRYQSWLLPYLEGSLDPEKKVLLEAQLARDPALMAEAEQLRLTVTALRASAADQEPLPATGFSVWPGVQARIQNQPQRSFGRAWALGGVGVAAAAAGILMVTLSIHPAKTPISSPSSIAMKPAVPPSTMQASRVSENKTMPAPMTTNLPSNSAKQKVVSKPISAQSEPKLVAGAKVPSIPILPVPVNGKAGRDPFGLPTQKTHPTMMAQVPKQELNSPFASPMLLPPMPVTAQSSVKPHAPETLTSERRDKDAVLPPTASPKEFGAERGATHKDIVPGGNGAAIYGFGGGGNSNGIAPQDAGDKFDANVSNSTDTAALPPAPNKITIPLPAAPRVLSAAPAPALGQVQGSGGNSGMADSSIQSNQAPNQTIISKSQNYSETAGNNAPTIAQQQSEIQLRMTMSAPQYGSVDIEKQTQQLLESLRSSGALGTLRQNLLQERKQHPEDLETSRLLAALSAFLNDKDTALAERRRIVGLNGATAEDWYQLAIAAQHKSDMATARNAYFQVLQIGGLNNPDHYAQARQFFTDSSKH